MGATVLPVAFFIQEVLFRAKCMFFKQRHLAVVQRELITRQLLSCEQSAPIPLTHSSFCTKWFSAHAHFLLEQIEYLSNLQLSSVSHKSFKAKIEVEECTQNFFLTSKNFYLLQYERKRIFLEYSGNFLDIRIFLNKQDRYKSCSGNNWGNFHRHIVFGRYKDFHNWKL